MQENSLKKFTISVGLCRITYCYGKYYEARAGLTALQYFSEFV